MTHLVSLLHIISVTNIISEVTHTLNHEKVVSFFRAPPNPNLYITYTTHKLVQTHMLHQIH